MSFDNPQLSKSTTIDGLVVIKNSSFREKRGEIWTSFESSIFSELCPYPFIHDKFSFSHKNVLRGFHGDNKTWKLVSCPYGKIFIAIIDMRKNSATYLSSEHFILDSSSRTHILLPPGLGNSFLVLSDNALYHYKLAYQGGYNDISDQFTVQWNDPRFSIPWPCQAPILSERDK